METRASRQFSNGFVLTEQELRRIADISREQFVKLQVPHSEAYELQFSSGAISTTADLSEVLAQENHGSAQITRLSMTFSGRSSSETGLIELNFRDLNALDEEKRPVSLQVQASSRDWVFITSSLLEERINKIKRRRLGKLITGRVFTWVMVGSIYAFLVVALSRDTFSYRGFTKPRPERQAGISGPLRKAYEQGAFKDAGEAIVVREELIDKANRSYQENLKKWEQEHDAWYKATKRKNSPLWLMAVLFLVSPPVLLGSLWLFFEILYPAFNFCWGDYLDVFKRKEGTRRFWVIIILAGIIVSFIGGVLANLLNVR